MPIEMPTIYLTEPDEKYAVQVMDFRKEMLKTATILTVVQGWKIQNLLKIG